MTRRSRFAVTLALGAAALASGAAVAQVAGGPPAWASVLSTDYPFVGVHDLAVTPDGPVAVGGAEDELRLTDGVGTGTAFDLGPEYGAGGGLSFVYAADADGIARWARPVGTDGAPFETYHVAAEGALVVTGEGVLYRPEPYRWATGSTTIVGRDGSDGDVRWSVDLGQAIPTEVQRSAVAYGIEVQDGVVYAAGVFRDTLVVGRDTLTVEGEGGEPYGEWFDTFVFALDAATGDPVWARSVRIGEADRDPLLRAVGFDPLGARAAFGIGDGVYLAGTFPAGARISGGSTESDVPLNVETALVRFSLDGTYEQSWAASDLGVNDDIRDPDNPNDPNTTFEARPHRLATGPGEPVAITWSFVRQSNGTGPSTAAWVAAGDTLFRSPEVGRGTAGTLVTRHDANGAFEWAVALAGNGYPTAWGLDVDRHGRVAVGAESDSDVLSVGGFRTPRRGAGDGFVVVVGPAGEVERLVHVSDDGDPGPSGAGRPFQAVRAVAFDESALGPEGSGGVVYAAGRFRGSFEVGGDVLRAEGEGRVGVFVARFDLDGVVSTYGGPEAAPLVLTAWPNPAATAVRLSVGGATGPVSVRVLDVLGREVARVDRHRGEVVLGVSGWAPGVYVVEAREEGTGRRVIRAVTVAR